jgi:hypothetical protein
MWEGHSVPRQVPGGSERDKNRRAERASHIGGTQDDQNEDNPNNPLVPTIAKRSGGTM